jgi:two-component sensor histidine kinase/Flp pilus assembly protein TadD
MTRIRLVCFLVFLFTGNFLHADAVDSLKNLLNKAAEPAQRMELLYQLTDQLYSAKPKEALGYAKESLSLAESLANINIQAKSQFLLIYIYYFLGQADEGIEAGIAATRLAKTIKDAELEADGYYILGYHYYDKGQIDQARNSYQQCLSISEQNNYSKGIGKGAKGLGDLSESSGDYQAAIASYRKCLEIGQSMESQRNTIVAYNDLGRIYDQMGNYDQGLEYYLQGLKLAEATQDNRLMASLTSNVASLHYFQKNYPKALEYAEKASLLFADNEDEAGVGRTAQTIGNVLFRQEKYEAALEKFTECLAIQEKRNNQRGLSYAYFNLAKTHLKLGDQSKALELHLKSLDIRENMDFQLGIAASCLAIGQIYTTQKQFKPALRYLQRSLQLAEETGAYTEMNDAYGSLAKCYSAMGDYKNAYDYQQLYRETRDSLFNQDRNQAIANMQIGFETEKKEAQIGVLEQEKVFLAGIRQKDQQVKLLLGFGLLLLFGLAFLFWNQSRLKQKANALLQSKNEEIAQKSAALGRSLQEKEVLLREVHHRVKNNLQMVSSLLNLQASEVQNESVLASIREGKNRVEAMSLIHENLYQSDQLKDVDIAQYLEQLLGHLGDAFTQKGKSIKLNLAAQNIRFNIDTAIPLGLVINELVTNAYKYAFSEQDIGQIEVSIHPIANDTYELRIADNGKGMPPDFEPKKSNSLGLRLVNMLSTLQLKGNFEYRYQNGAEFKVRFQELRSPQAKTA